MTRDEVEQAFAAAARVHWAEYMAATQAGDPLTAELERARFVGLWSAAEAMHAAASVAAILTYPGPLRSVDPGPCPAAPTHCDCIGEGVE